VALTFHQIGLARAELRLKTSRQIGPSYSCTACGRRLNEAKRFSQGLALRLTAGSEKTGVSVLLIVAAWQAGIAFGICIEFMAQQSNPLPNPLGTMQQTADYNFDVTRDVRGRARLG
jgi:hypothetical protein